MILPPSRNELFNYNTPNSAKAVFCFNKRPCWRFEQCKYCRSRKRKFIIAQVCHFTFAWNLKVFVTATLINYNGAPSSAVETLQEVRRIFNKRCFKDRKYVSFLSVDENSVNSNRVVPHFHFLLDSNITREDLVQALKSVSEQLKWDLNITPIDRTPHGVRGLGGYLMDQNFFKTLRFQKRGARLITASRGFRTGKPFRGWQVLFPIPKNYGGEPC